MRGICEIVRRNYSGSTHTTTVTKKSGNNISKNTTANIVKTFCIGNVWVCYKTKEL